MTKPSNKAPAWYTRLRPGDPNDPRPRIFEKPARATGPRYYVRYYHAVANLRKPLWLALAAKDLHKAVEEAAHRLRCLTSTIVYSDKKLRAEIEADESAKLAEHVKAISAGIKKLEAGLLKRDTIVLLLHDATKVSRRDVNKVLDGLTQLAGKYLNLEPDGDGEEDQDKSE